MAMDYKDYYKTLGVPRDADEKAIKKAFRALARKLHPDVNPGDKAAEEKFKEINEANEVLGDPEKRAKYDQFGSAWQQYQQQPGGRPGDFNWDSWRAQPNTQRTYATTEDLEGMFGSAGGFSSFFETLFGQPTGGNRGRVSGRAPRASRGQDFEHPLQVSLAEAYTGAERLLNKDGERLTVKIPPGVRTGSKVRVRGGGTAGMGGGPAGDLYLVVEVKPNHRFERHGDDLATTVDVPLYTAVLGGEVTVPTLAGDVQLTVPPETQNGRRFRLTGQGMPKLKSPAEHGDLIVTARVKLPTGLSDEERQLFEQLRSLWKG